MNITIINDNSQTFHDSLKLFLWVMSHGLYWTSAINSGLEIFIMWGYSNMHAQQNILHDENCTFNHYCSIFRSTPSNPKCDWYLCIQNIQMFIVLNLKKIIRNKYHPTYCKIPGSNYTVLMIKFKYTWY